MGIAFAVPFGSATDPNTAKRVFRFTAAEPAEVAVECMDLGGGVVNSPTLVGTYLDKQTFTATVTAYNAAGLPQQTPTPCTVTINVPAPVVVAPPAPALPAAADPITSVSVVTV